MAFGSRYSVLDRRGCAIQVIDRETGEVVEGVVGYSVEASDGEAMLVLKFAVPFEILRTTEPVEVQTLMGTGRNGKPRVIDRTVKASRVRSA